MAQSVTSTLALTRLLLTAVGLAAGCQTPPAAVEPVRVDPANCCPLTGTVLTTEEHVAYFDAYPVFFDSGESAARFGSLTTAQQALAATAQVLPKKGIPNRICPISGGQLTAAAVLVVHLDQRVGFADQSSAIRFLALRPEEQDALLARWRLTMRARQGPLPRSADAG